MINNPSDHKFTSEGIVSRFIKGVSANSLGILINFASRVLLVPLFLKAWGVTVYGEWLLLSSFVAYLSLTDLGGQLYIINRLTKIYVQKDFELFRKTLHTGLALFLILPGIVYSIFMCIMLVFKPITFLNIQETAPNIVLCTLAILAFQFAFSLPQGILLGTYRSIGKLPKGIMMSNLISIFQIVFVGLGLLLRLGLPAIAMLQVFPYIPMSIFAVIDLNKQIPDLDIFSFRFTSFSTVLSFVKPSLNFFLIQMSKTLLIQGIVLIVGIVLTPVQVVIFSTNRTLVNLLGQTTSLITHSVWPEVTRLDSEQDHGQMIVLFKFIMRTTLLSLAFLIPMIYFFGEIIYKMWLNSAIDFQQQVLNLFLLYLFQLSFWTVCSHFLMATNRHDVLSKITLTASVCSIVLSYFLGIKYGLNGVIWGMIIADLLIPFWSVPVLLHKHHPMFSAHDFFRELLPVMIAIALVARFPVVSPVVIIPLVVWWWRLFSQMKSLSHKGIPT